MSRTLLATAAALATLTSFAATASAREATTGQAAVSYADLDLGTSQGQAELSKRIDTAARSVCSTRVTGTRIAATDYACVAKAKAQIEHQLVALRSSQRSGG